MTITERPAPPLPSFMTARKASEKKEEEPSRQAPGADQAAINVEKIDRNINESLRKRVTDIITKNPDLTLAILRGWKKD
jgi:hypothetical protein